MEVEFSTRNSVSNAFIVLDRANKLIFNKMLRSRPAGASTAEQIFSGDEMGKLAAW